MSSIRPPHWAFLGFSGLVSSSAKCGVAVPLPSVIPVESLHLGLVKRREWMSVHTTKVFRKGPLGATKRNLEERGGSFG